MWFAAERKRAPDGSRRPLLTIVRVSSPCVLICRHGKSNPGIWAAANQPDGQITSDFQKWCQAPKSKIFLFSPDPNQFYIPRCLAPQRADGGAIEKGMPNG